MECTIFYVPSVFIFPSKRFPMYRFHKQMFYNDPINLEYPIMANGIVRLLAGVQPRTMTLFLASLTYFVEVLWVEYEALINHTMIPYKAHLVAVLSFILGVATFCESIKFSFIYK